VAPHWSCTAIWPGARRLRNSGGAPESTAQSARSTVRYVPQKRARSFSGSPCPSPALIVQGGYAGLHREICEHCLSGTAAPQLRLSLTVAVWTADGAGFVSAGCDLGMDRGPALPEGRVQRVGQLLKVREPGSLRIQYLVNLSRPPKQAVVSGTRSTFCAIIA
jgi:hypothetical protein